MHNREAFWAAIVVAAGAGSRFGAPAPKQFLRLGGKPVLRWCVEAFLARPEIRSVLVVHPEGGGQAARVASMLPADSRLRFCSGGATRTASTLNGLAALDDLDPTHVMIHDAARPGLTAGVITELTGAFENPDIAGAAPALPMADSVKHASGDQVRSIARDGLVRVQTPQAFRYRELLQALSAQPDATFTDELSVIESAGSRIVLTPGRHELMKITHAEDLAIVERLIAPGASSMNMRIGNGFDVHAFAPGDGVVICGVRVPHTHGLEGHSDADVAWHALTDAILGAAALGDIGQHFPPSDPQWKGAASIRFLQYAQALAAEAGFAVVNADITLICERPKIGPHRDAMRASTATALGLDLSRVSVKATTTEKLGFTGRGEGVAAQAVVLLSGK